jgi:plastocyanin
VIRSVALLLLAATVAGCGRPPEPVSDPDLRAELGIPDETAIHRVELSGVQSENRVEPLVLEAAPGDVVQFVVMDHRVHLIRFLVDEMREDQRAFLARTSQDRPPPLLERDARLVLTFAGAPEGSYPYSSEGNGPPVRGEIRIATTASGTPRDL